LTDVLENVEETKLGSWKF